MQVEIVYRPAFSLAVVTLQPGERIRAEAGSMVSMSDGVSLETSAGGGIMAALKRSLLGGGRAFSSMTTRRRPRGAASPWRRPCRGTCSPWN
jgi:uncharacterized protein (AIM24 family)